MAGDEAGKGTFIRFGVILAVVVALIAVPAVTLSLACGGCALIMGKAAQVADAKMEGASAEEQSRVDAKAREAVALASKITGESAGSYGPLNGDDTAETDDAARAAEQRKAVEEGRKRVLDKAAALAERLKLETKVERTRVWQTPDGTFKIEAEFVRQIDGKVTLRKADGSEIEMDVANLSDEDKAWLEAKLAGKSE